MTESENGTMFGLNALRGKKVDPVFSLSAYISYEGIEDSPIDKRVSRGPVSEYADTVIANLDPIKGRRYYASLAWHQGGLEGALRGCLQALFFPNEEPGSHEQYEDVPSDPEFSAILYEDHKKAIISLADQMAERALRFAPGIPGIRKVDPKTHFNGVRLTKDDKTGAPGYLSSEKLDGTSYGLFQRYLDALLDPTQDPAKLLVQYDAVIASKRLELGLSKVKLRDRVTSATTHFFNRLIGGRK